MGFKKLDQEDFIVASNTVTSTVWSNNQPFLNTFQTSSTQVASNSGRYYYNVYENDPETNPQEEVQFSVAFGDKEGRGTPPFDENVEGISPSKSIYGQYSSLFLEGISNDFNFGDNNTSKHIYVISIERARYKEKLLPGSFLLKLNNGGNKLALTDNSKEVQIPLFFGTQRGFYLVRTDFDNPILGEPLVDDPNSGFSSQNGAYGIFFPDTSTIILNGSALDEDPTPSGENIGGIGLGTVLSTDGSNPDNINKLINAFYTTDPLDPLQEASETFRLNSEETITSNFIFIRIRNSEFNYSENPSFVKAENGELIYDYFINNPQVYPTTIGLYNDSNELLAIAKLSRPVQKDFTKEALFRIKLDF